MLNVSALSCSISMYSESGIKHKKSSQFFLDIVKTFLPPPGISKVRKFKVLLFYFV